MTMSRTGLLFIRRVVAGRPLRPAIQSALLHCASTSHKLPSTQRACWSTSRAMLSTDMTQLMRRRQIPLLCSGWRQQSQCFSSKSGDHDFSSQLIHETREGSNPLERADRPSVFRSQAKTTSASETRSPYRVEGKAQFSSASSSGQGNSSSSATPFSHISKSSFSKDSSESPPKSENSAPIVEEITWSDATTIGSKSDKLTDKPPSKRDEKKTIELDKKAAEDEEKEAVEEKKKVAEEGKKSVGDETKAFSGERSEHAKKTEDGPKSDDDHKELEEKRKRLEKTNRNTKRAFMVFATIIVVGGACFVLYYAIPERDNQGNWTQDEFSRYPIPLSNLYRVLHQVNLWKDYVKEPSREDLLPPPLPAPYIQPKYTLVIELKNVLLAPEWSYSTGWRFKKRPAIEYFLDTVGYPNFEVVIYTSEPSMTAAPLVDSFDPKQRIMYRCYRDCTKYMKGHHVKDLEKLRRDMSKVIMMDHDPQSFQLNPENALRIPSWNGDMNDTALVDLAELLKTIYLSDVDDVRPTLQYYSQFDDPAKEFRRRATFLAQQELEQKKSTESQYSMVKNYAGRLFGYRRHS